jgi:adenosylcobinamide-GDP ribazoletransferase
MEKQVIAPKLAFLTAIQFLTRIPVKGGMDGTPEFYRAALKASTLYFPLVGVLIGLFTSCLYGTCCWLWSSWIAAIIAVAGEAWLTGAFHEDAIADATDALGGGWTREQVLEILKDSRHGTYGVIALVLGVSLRIGLIAQCEPLMAFFAIPISAGVGRWAILLMMHQLEPIEDRHTQARDVGSMPCLKEVAKSASWPTLFFGLCWSLVFFGFPSVSRYQMLSQVGLGFLMSWIVATLVTWYYVGLVRRRVGGVTGDFLGANCYLVQLASLLAMTASIH